MPRRARRAPPALVALVAALALGACGGDGGERDDIRSYIDDANAIQRGGAQDLEKANAAYKRFSRGKRLGPVAVAELQDTVGRLRDTRERLAGLPAPTQARTLRERLLAVFDGNIALAREAAQLAVYVPAARRAAARLGRLGSVLRRGLDDATPAGQAQALRRYARQLGALESRLRELTPPPVLVAGHRSQLLRLSTARSLSDRLRGAIARRDSGAVARLLLRFRSVYAASGLDAGVQRKALRAYTDRLRGLAEATGALQREQSRLDRLLTG